MSGTFTQGGGSGKTVHTEVSEGFSGGASGSGYVEDTSSYNRAYAGSATLTLRGATGLYEQWGAETQNWDSRIDLEWQEDEFVATGGSGSNVAFSNVGEKFNGTGNQTATGSSATVSYKFAKNDTYLENQYYDYSPSTDLWVLTSGDGVGDGADSFAYRTSLTEDYTTEEYGIAGVKTAGQFDNDDTWWDYTTEWSASASGGAGGWTSQGSGTSLGGWGKNSGYSASGSISMGSVTGTYDEGGDDSERFDYELRLQLHDGVWTKGGSGTGSGGGGSHKIIHLEDSNWSHEGHGESTISGSATQDSHEEFGYGYDYEAMLPSADAGWVMLGGSGSGDGGAGYLFDASGSGGYTGDIDDGAGSFSGTQSFGIHDGWDYSYHQDYNFDTGTGEWSTSESGSGSSDGTCRGR